MLNPPLGVQSGVCCGSGHTCAQPGSTPGKATAQDKKDKPANRAHAEMTMVTSSTVWSARSQLACHQIRDTIGQKEGETTLAIRASWAIWTTGVPSSRGRGGAEVTGTRDAPSPEPECRRPLFRAGSVPLLWTKFREATRGGIGKARPWLAGFPIGRHWGDQAPTRSALTDRLHLLGPQSQAHSPQLVTRPRGSPQAPLQSPLSLNSSSPEPLPRTPPPSPGRTCVLAMRCRPSFTTAKAALAQLALLARTGPAASASGHPP